MVLENPALAVARAVRLRDCRSAGPEKGRRVSRARIRAAAGIAQWPHPAIRLGSAQFTAANPQHRRPAARGGTFVEILAARQTTESHGVAARSHGAPRTGG